MLAELESFLTALSKAARAAQNTITGYRRDLLAFRDFLLERRLALEPAAAEVSPDAVSADDIRAYLAAVLKTSKRATAQRRLSAIKAFFRYREAALGTSNPARAIRSPRSERRLPAVLREEEVRRLIETDGSGRSGAIQRDRAILETLYSSGLRVSELVGLNWADLDEELGMVRVRAGKGNKDRLVPIGEPALQALLAWRKAMPVAWELEGPVITNLKGA
jgi:integrase/recombinase XerC